MNLRLGRFSPRLAKLLAPGFGWCLRCKTPWPFVKLHSTPYGHLLFLDASGGLAGGSKGCFPLCEKCWQGLTIEERLPYYHELVWEVWEDRTQEDWQHIRGSVLAGR